MFKKTAMLFFYSETPFHAGAGASVSHVDLPIQREKHTGHPIVQASGVKGAFRDWAKQFSIQPKKIPYVFGPEPDSDTASEHGGALAFTDAQLLFFPLRSFSGGFAWITCPMVINRLSRKLEMANFPSLPAFQVSDEKILLPDTSDLIADNNMVILEDFAFKKEQEKNGKIEQLAQWITKNAIPQNGAFKYIRDNFEKRMAIVSDNTFKDFVMLSTEVVTRIRIGENGVVQKGALWSQELLPGDSILYSMALAKDMQYSNNELKSFSSDESINFLKDMVYNSDKNILQMGGDETVGRGIVRVQFLENI